MTSDKTLPPGWKLPQTVIVSGDASHPHQQIESAPTIDIETSVLPETQVESAPEVGALAKVLQKLDQNSEWKIWKWCHCVYYNFT